MILPILGLGAASFVISWGITWLMIRLAPRIGFVDQPGGHKAHTNSTPLGGGVAIYWGIVIPLLGALAYLNFAYQSLLQRYAAQEFIVALLKGGHDQTKLSLAFVGAMLALHALGFLDDRKPLGPFIKLVVQLAVTASLVIGFREMRVLTALDNMLGSGNAPSVTLTVLWIVAITNAFNFLDNMDGLSAGVATVCAIAFLITTILIGQWFVAASLALLIGSLLGFLFWNFPPAKIFMGDSGSLVVGFVLGVLTVRTTFIAKGVSWAAGWYAVFAPVIVLALPLYDLFVVSLIRLSRGKSPFVGDNNHFSHRLVARGMSRRTAVLCLYLITAATSISAILLPYVTSSFAAILIFCQTILILCMVALLEQHPLPEKKDETA